MEQPGSVKPLSDLTAEKEEASRLKRRIIETSLANDDLKRLLTDEDAKEDDLQRATFM